MGNLNHEEAKKRTSESGIAEAIRQLAGIFSTYVSNARDGENGHSLYTTPNGYPVKVALETSEDLSISLLLEGDAMDSIADSLKRIADAMSPT